MKGLGTTLILAGVTLLLLGVFSSMGGSLSWLGRLPGDIHVSRPGFSLCLPITTSILISIVISVVMYLLHLFR